MPLDSHYLLLSMNPPTQDVLTIRKTISDALELSFGMTFFAVYIDILWVDNEGAKSVIRVHKE